MAFRDFWHRLGGGSDPARASSTTHPSPASSPLQGLGGIPRVDGPYAGRRTLVDRDDVFVHVAYGILLGRVPDEHMRGTFLRLLELGQPRSNVLLALTSSPEFRLHQQVFAYFAMSTEALTNAERVYASLGTNSAFVEAAYACVLGRDADPGGRANYVAALDGGGTRIALVAEMLRSEEFGRRYRELCPSGGTVPCDVQLCELANPAKWDNPEWIGVLRELRIPAEAKVAMHRKAYEFTQTVWGLRRLGALHDEASILSVGAGHEGLAYSLANMAGRVLGTDLYTGEWTSIASAEGDARVLVEPEAFAPFPYRRERLRFLPMNGCALGLRDDTFDVAYSLSSIEHFGGWQGARHAVEEMARVVKPGGLVVVATEWVVSGPSRDEVFLPEEFRRLIDVRGLSLVEPLDDLVWRRNTGPVIDVRRNPFETPHMLVRIEQTTFTSVLVFLRKDVDHDAT